MSEAWYESVSASAALLQGDFILDCPVLAWKAERPVVEVPGNGEVLTQLREIVKLDVIVMTQACDLEQCKVSEVVVCSMYQLDQFKAEWEERKREESQTPTAKAWRNYCEDIRGGFLWNYAMLNRGDIAGLTTNHRIVDFHDIHTLPIEFLSGVAAQRGPRLRLRPPYREHLSQAFARYFMRVGLPWSVEVAW